jgi:hypothetical protein
MRIPRENKQLMRLFMEEFIIQSKDRQQLIMKQLPQWQQMLEYMPEKPSQEEFKSILLKQSPETQLFMRKIMNQPNKIKEFIQQLIQQIMDQPEQMQLYMQQFIQPQQMQPFAPPPSEMEYGMYPPSGAPGLSAIAKPFVPPTKPSILSAIAKPFEPPPPKPSVLSAIAKPFEPPPPKPSVLSAIAKPFESSYHHQPQKQPALQQPQTELESELTYEQALKMLKEMYPEDDLIKYMPSVTKENKHLLDVIYKHKK